MNEIIHNMKINFKKMDKILLFLSIILIIWGLLSIVSASSRVAVLDNEVDVFYYFYRQLIMITVGCIGAFVIINVPSSKYLVLSRISYIVILCVLLYLSFNGTSHRGAQNWLSVGGIKFQPSEFAKPILIVYLSAIFDEYYKSLQSKNVKTYLYVKIVFVSAFIPLIIYFQKDFGTMLIILSAVGVLFLCSPIKRISKLRLVLIGISLLAILISIILVNQKSLFTNAQNSRFQFFNPCDRYETGGYQICNGFIAINDGNLFGLGLGESKQKYSYIPEPHTDSIFSIIAEENGFIRSSLILILMLLLIYRIVAISCKSITIRGRYICLGVATYIFTHMFINLGGLFGIIPLTGVPLPFFSYGGSFIICLIMSLGLVQRVYIENNLRRIS